MRKFGRNEPCPCGSGKKYKKCCINKEIEDIQPELPLRLPEIKENPSFRKYLTSNNSIEFLKIFSLLQLIPKNQSKEFRLEDIQMTICKNLNSNNSEVNYDELKNLILEEYQYNHREDPCEAAFTENIMFYNGNNIVFPGMTNDSTVLNQNLLHAILFLENNLSESSKKKIKEGALFLLHVFNEIAKALGYTRNIFEDDDWRGDIFFPSNSFLTKHTKHVEFNKEDIKKIYEDLKIESNIITEFISSVEEIKKSTFEKNVLTYKPFIDYDGKYYLVMPSCQMSCLNNFIIKTIESFNEINELTLSYKSIINNETGKYLSSIWRQVNVRTPLYEEETIWQIDTNKYAYVNIIAIESNKAEDRVNNIIRHIKKELDKEDIEFLVVHITAPMSIEFYSLMITHIDEAKYQFTASYFNIERLITFWNIDKLSFWKYFRARERAVKKGIMMLPAFSILTYFNWYKRNFESFFPTDEKYPNLIAFDFAIQGGIIMDANKKNDKHFVFHYNENVLGYLPVIRTETYAPIYTSEEIFNGLLRVCIEKYICPIWVSLKSTGGPHGKSFIDSILFWLNEFHDYLNTLLVPLGELPVEIILEFEESFNQINLEEIETNHQRKILIKYRIEPRTRKIYMKIPVGIFNALNRSDNHGERVLMGCVIKGFSNLLQIADYNEITEDEIENILDQYMPLGRAKMILTMTTNNIQTESRFIPKVRFLQDSDTSIVLENNIKWLNYDNPIPEKIVDREQKIKLCLDLINSLIHQLRERLKEYNSKKLLEFLMLKHEALIQDGASWSIQIPARLECFTKYTDVIEEFTDHEAKRVKTSLSVRNLIEFVIAEPYFENKEGNDDDVDFLLAIMCEIINYGTIKDSIQFNIDNPDIGLLPSGRIGIEQEFYKNILVKYRSDTTDDEILDFKESFDNKFRNKPNSYNSSTDNNKLDLYYENVDRTFSIDWGVNLSEIDSILFFLSEYCLENEKSFMSCSENEFKNLLKEKLKFDEKLIESFIEQMVLETRGKLDVPNNSSNYSDIFPWRYNRRLSYIRRPILKIKNNDSSYTFYWSMRHLDMASKNLLAIFHNGVLKVNPSDKNINRLLAERNNIKGKEFRKEVYEWLNSHWNIEVIPYEVPIKEKGILKADRNYGDIDILAFNHSSKTIFSIECKNTKQAKIMYDFHNHIKNYIDKQLPKHLNREKWLENNKSQLEEAFKLTSGKYKIQSMIISSYRLPVKYTHKTSIPIYSFNEIKENDVFNH